MVYKQTNKNKQKQTNRKQKIIRYKHTKSSLQNTADTPATITETEWVDTFHLSVICLKVFFYPEHLHMFRVVLLKSAFFIVFFLFFSRAFGCWQMLCRQLNKESRYRYPPKTIHAINPRPAVWLEVSGGSHTYSQILWARLPWVVTASLNIKPATSWIESHTYAAVGETPWKLGQDRASMSIRPI